MALPIPQSDQPHAMMDWAIAWLRVRRFDVEARRDRGDVGPRDLEEIAALSFLIAFLSQARSHFDDAPLPSAEKEPAPWLVEMIEREGADPELARRIAYRLSVDARTFRNFDLRPGWIY